MCEQYGYALPFGLILILSYVAAHTLKNASLIGKSVLFLVCVAFLYLSIESGFRVEIDLCGVPVTLMAMLVVVCGAMSADVV